MEKIINGIDMTNPLVKGVNLIKPVKFKEPQPGEENLIFRVANYNEVTNRVIIELQSDKFNFPPRQLVSLEDVTNC